MNKLFEIIEAIALMLLTAVCVVGVINYAKSLEEEKLKEPIVEKPPVVEEKPEELPVEILTMDIQLHTSGFDYVVLYTIEFEKGMTWEEWINSDYNNTDIYLYEHNENNTWIRLGGTDKILHCYHSTTLPDEVMESTFDSYFFT